MSKIENKLDSFIAAKGKSPAQLRVEMFLEGKITQSQYGELLRKEVQESEDRLLVKIKS